MIVEQNSNAVVSTRYFWEGSTVCSKKCEQITIMSYENLQEIGINAMQAFII